MEKITGKIMQVRECGILGVNKNTKGKLVRILEEPNEKGEFLVVMLDDTSAEYLVIMDELQPCE